jgi:5'-nucleotidase
MRNRSFLVALVVLLLAACSSSKPSASSTTTTTSSSAPAPTNPTTAAPLHVLVTNDDGVSAPGIDALVQGLRTLPGTTVAVVAPATNESGSGSKSTLGSLTAHAATTKSGYPATAIAAYPVDTIVWAIDQHHVSPRPDVVFSGVNAGQNLGRFVDVSGTVGAARAAAQRGVPALAVSQGLGTPIDFAAGVHAALTWLAAHHAELLARRSGSASAATVTNLNIPTCRTGSPRAVVRVPVAGPDANAFAPVDCKSTYTDPKNDVDAFVYGFVSETDNLPLTAAS